MGYVNAFNRLSTFLEHVEVVQSVLSTMSLTSAAHLVAVMNEFQEINVYASQTQSDLMGFAFFVIKVSINLLKTSVGHAYQTV